MFSPVSSSMGPPLDNAAVPDQGLRDVTLRARMVAMDVAVTCGCGGISHDVNLLPLGFSLKV